MWCILSFLLNSHCYYLQCNTQHIIYCASMFNCYLMSSPKISPEPLGYMKLQLAFHQVTKDRLKLHEHLFMGVLAVSVRGRGEGLITGLQQLGWVTFRKSYQLFVVYS